LIRIWGSAARRGDGGKFGRGASGTKTFWRSRASGDSPREGAA
jgi:hypothetical protein